VFLWLPILFRRSRVDAGPGGLPVHVAIWCFLGLLTVCSLSIEFWSRSLAYESQLEQSRVASRNIAQAAVEHADATLQTVTWALDGIVERVETDGTEGEAHSRLRRFLISRVRSENSPLQGLFVIDRTGKWLVNTFDHVSTTVNYADRPYFIFHRTNPSRAVHIGGPVQSRATGEWVMTVTRRINDANGDFGGLAMATIPVRFFQQYYERFAVGKRGVMLLVITDGRVVTQVPKELALTGNDIRRTPFFDFVKANRSHHATTMLMTNYDRTVRLHSFRRSISYPLIVNVALGKEEMFADWWRVTWQEAAAVLAMLASMYAMGFWLVAQVRTRAQLEARLRATQADLEARNAELDRMAYVDGLSGLHNRRYLDERMAEEMARAVREGTPLSLILIDVDYFKRYNDMYGHAAGDDCLRMIGETLAGTVNRPADVAARFGGEEFAVLLPATGREGALNVAERIRGAVSGRAIPHRGSELETVTISAGVASVVPGNGEGIRALVEAADAGLYAAKAGGRNAVHASRNG
jgi:diguanylate cyclase (GGDEF)-like protein